MWVATKWDFFGGGGGGEGHVWCVILFVFVLFLGLV